MTKLSVNINKIALIRNSRGGNVPNILEVAKDCENFGAEGITVHPRPDERHIRYSDVADLKKIVKTELNVEGNPTQKFMDLVLEVIRAQVTLVPDKPDALTSDSGWDTVSYKSKLVDIIKEFKQKHIRTSIFVDANTRMIEGALETGADRIELYTEYYAKNYDNDREKAIKNFITAANLANKIGLGVNAGHDLDHRNLKYFHRNIPNLMEVSIGHALVSQSLYWGLENTIQIYLRELKN